MKSITFLTFLFFFNCNQLNAQSSHSELTLIFNKIENLWSTKLVCDSLNLYVHELHDPKGACALLHTSLEGNLYNTALLPFKEKINSLIEMRADCQGSFRFYDCKNPIRKYDWHSKLVWSLKYLYYSIDYIGLDQIEKMDQLVKLLPEISKKKRFGSIALNFERAHICNIINDIPINHLRQIPTEEAAYIKKQLIWAATFTRFSKLNISDEDLNTKLHALERG